MMSLQVTGKACFRRDAYDWWKSEENAKFDLHLNSSSIHTQDKAVNQLSRQDSTTKRFEILHVDLY